MHGVHSQREWISVQDMARAVQVLLQLARLWEERSA
jgi:tripeptide aminopeptidase